MRAAFGWNTESSSPFTTLANDDMTIYEMHGRMAEQLETEQAAHRSTVEVLIALKAGALRLDQVDVDAGKMSWATFPDREAPAAPVEQAAQTGHPEDEGRLE